MQRLRVIGLIVSKLGIQVNPDRLQAITEFQNVDFNCKLAEDPA